MELSLTSLSHRLNRAKKAFATREESQQISARTAKLITDIGTRRVTPTEAVSKALALYLRRQKHVYGKKAFDKTINEITAFLSETGDIEALIDVNDLRTNDLKVSIDDDKAIAALYKDKGPYGIIQLIESQIKLKTRSQKASELLRLGKVVKTQLGELGVRSELAHIALALDKSEPTYRGVCWSFINDEQPEQALIPFAHLYFYYQQYPDKPNTYFQPLLEKLTNQFGADYIENYLSQKEDDFQNIIEEEILEQYRIQLNLSDKQQQEQLFGKLLSELNVDKVINFIDTDERFNNKAKALLALRAVKAAKSNLHDVDTYTTTVEALADYALSKDNSESTLRNAYFSYQRIHAHKKSEEVLTLLAYLAGSEPTQEQRRLLWSSPQHLITLVNQVPEYRQTPAYQPVEGKVCYVIHNSLPYSSGGYATRGHGLVTAIKQQGVDIYAVTRPGYPHDISPIKVEEINLEDYIDGVVYKRLLSPSRRDYSNYEYMLKAVESYKQSFMRDKPALIIAASNHLDGLPAMFAARSLGIPFIYEIRGFWEVTRLSKYPEFEHDPMFKVEKRLEAVVAEHANHIFTLTQGMIDELETRGVDTKGRITLLPNSCDVERFHPTSVKDEPLAAQWNIPLNIPVIGYIGTLVSYEGLDDLATACAELKQMGYEFRLLIVGNENATGQGKGSIVSQIQNIATEGGFEDWLIMPGRVPFEEVERYYSLIDIAPFPRKAWPVCEIVPPMKTLEALSMQKPVIVSSNKALTEMITHDENGLIFERGDTDDLINQLKYLLDHPEKWEAYGKAGRQFVENERTWVRTAQKATAIIEQTLL